MNSNLYVLQYLENSLCNGLNRQALPIAGVDEGESHRFKPVVSSTEVRNTIPSQRKHKERVDIKFKSPKHRVLIALNQTKRHVWILNEYSASIANLRHVFE